VRTLAKRRRHELSLFCGEDAFDLPSGILSKVEYFSICSAEYLCIWNLILVNREESPMNFAPAILVLAEETAGTSTRLSSLSASDRRRARIEKNIDRTGDAFCDAAQLLERCLPRSFGI
jgi:hypothetical protein